MTNIKTSAKSRRYSHGLLVVLAAMGIFMVQCVPLKKDLGSSSHPEDKPHRYAQFIHLHALPKTGDDVQVYADVELHISGESFDDGAVVSFDVELHGGTGTIDPETASVKLVSAMCTHGGEEPVSLGHGEITRSDDGRTVIIPVALTTTGGPCPDDDDVDVDIEVRFRRAVGEGTSGTYPVTIANVLTTIGETSTKLTSGG